ncbi:MAG: hypothetical protein Q9210_003910 [Variospora velana]
MDMVKGSHWVGAGDDAEEEQNESDAQVLPAPVHSLTPTWLAEVMVDLVAAELRLR